MRRIFDSIIVGFDSYFQRKRNFLGFRITCQIDNVKKKGLNNLVKFQTLLFVELHDSERGRVSVGEHVMKKRCYEVHVFDNV